MIPYDIPYYTQFRPVFGFYTPLKYPLNVIRSIESAQSSQNRDGPNIYAIMNAMCPSA